MNSNFLSKKKYLIVSDRKIILFLIVLSFLFSRLLAEQNESTKGTITVNQIGYLINHPKIATVAAEGNEFYVVSTDNDKIVYKGNLSAEKYYDGSNEKVRFADFSSFNIPGNYKIRIGSEESYTFTIGNDIYEEISKAAFKKFYYARASIELEEKYAGKWKRSLGHEDSIVYIHKSAANEKREEGSIISSAKGWYDAGDYNKYIVNSGITTYTLMLMYEMFPKHFEKLNYNIPKSSNQIPDLLDEIKWNLDWMLTMQDPNDGGVYHKLTSKKFSEFIMPHEDKSERFVVMKSSAATLDFAAVMAQASRVYKKILPEYSLKCLRAAEYAFEWGCRNSEIYYKQPSDIVTGEYGSKNVKDEYQWAAIELFITTKNEKYLEGIDIGSIKCEVPSWSEVSTLGAISLLINKINIPKFERLVKNYYRAVDSLNANIESSGYKIANKTFRWGSNSDILNQSLLFIVAYQSTNESKYLDKAIINTDYVLGRNPLNICFVTGFGTKSPMLIHDRISEADKIMEPIPGNVVGGPNPKNITDCGKEKYPSLLPALCYIDDTCSYSTNEVAINWNAPLALVLSAINFYSK